MNEQSAEFMVKVNKHIKFPKRTTQFSKAERRKAAILAAVRSISANEMTEYLVYYDTPIEITVKELA